MRVERRPGSLGLLHRIIFAIVILGLIGTACSSGTDATTDDAAAASVGVVSTTGSSSTVPATVEASTSTSTISSTTSSSTTTPPVSFPPGDAGHAGSIGCRGECPVVGLQNLDGQSNVVLEDVVITNPTGRCLTIRGANKVVIRNVTISDCGTEEAVWDGYDTGLVLIEDSDEITIENSVISRMAGEDTGAARNNAVQVMDSTNVRIINNEFSDIFSDIGRKAGDQGNRAISAQGASSFLTIEKNTFRNAGRNALQLTRAPDLSGVSFSHNVVEGRGPWDSDYEDMVNLYSSSGLDDDPIVLHGNYLRNGGPSVSGTAMILGDGDTDNGPTENVVASDNVIVNPGHAGIVLAGGRNIVIRDNIVLGDVDVPHPTTTGLAVNDYGYVGGCSDHVVVGNRVYMRNQHLEDQVNHAWIPGTCTEAVVIEDNVFGDEELNPSVWNPR